MNIELKYNGKEIEVEVPEATLGGSVELLDSPFNIEGDLLKVTLFMDGGSSVDHLAVYDYDTESIALSVVL